MEIILSKTEILKNLNYDCDIMVFDTIDSTNTYLKTLAKTENVKEKTIVIATEQTNGRGRLGRSFFSKSKIGLYFSMLLRPKIHIKDSLLITTCAAASMYLAIKKLFNINCQIKWVNDIYLNNKKISGILTEAKLSEDNEKLSYAVLGIGINLLNDNFPDDIKNIAGCLFEEKTPQNAENLLVSEFVNIFLGFYENLENKDFFKTYKERLMYIGETVNVINADKSYKARVLGIDDEFRLRVLTEDNNETLLNSGEVSVKI